MGGRREGEEEGEGEGEEEEGEGEKKEEGEKEEEEEREDEGSQEEGEEEGKRGGGRKMGGEGRGVGSGKKDGGGAWGISKWLLGHWRSYQFSHTVLLHSSSYPAPALACRRGGETAFEGYGQDTTSGVPHLPISSNTIIRDSRFIIRLDFNCSLARLKSV